jgi:hypothetical protein
MPTLNSYDKVEKIALPHRYQAHASAHSHVELIKRYEDLKKEYIQAILRIDESSRAAWSMERYANTLLDLVDAKDIELARLAEAGRYAVYGKPEISPDDDYTDEEYNEGEEGYNAANAAQAINK